jgi:transcription elongation factor S-II
MTSVGEIYRKKAIEKITSIVAIENDEIIDLEKGIFNWTIDACNIKSIFPVWQNEIFRKLYNDKLISILTNLDMNSELKNTGLLERLQSKLFKPHDIPFMLPCEVFPEKWMSIINQKYKKEQSILDTNMQAKTDMFKCGKCKQRKCSYYEMQVRGADESSTIFITCLSCKNKWRIG